MRKIVVLLSSVLIVSFALIGCGQVATEKAVPQGTAPAKNTNNTEKVPVIESIAQTEGTGGDIIDLTVDYDATGVSRDSFTVLIDGQEAKIGSAGLSGKQFEFSLPLDLTMGKKTIEVLLKGKKSNSVSFEVKPPVIESISNSDFRFMYVSEAEFKINGKNLGYSKDKVKVSLNGKDLEIISINKDFINLIAKKGIQAGDIVVIVDGKEMKRFPVKVTN